MIFQTSILCVFENKNINFPIVDLIQTKKLLQHREKWGQLSTNLGAVFRESRSAKSQNSESFQGLRPWTPLGGLQRPPAPQLL